MAARITVSPTPTVTSTRNGGSLPARRSGSLERRILLIRLPPPWAGELPGLWITFHDLDSSATSYVNWRRLPRPGFRRRFREQDPGEGQR